MRLRLGGILGVALGVGGSAAWAQTPSFWLGSWSPDPACGAESIIHVFSADQFELREGERRLYLGKAKVEQRGDRLIVRLTADVQGFEEDEDGPRSGDTIVYRRKGDRIRPDTFTRDDLTHANPEFGPEFHRCPR